MCTIISYPFLPLASIRPTRSVLVLNNCSLRKNDNGNVLFIISISSVINLQQEQKSWPRIFLQNSGAHGYSVLIVLFWWFMAWPWVNWTSTSIFLSLAGDTNISPTDSLRANLCKTALTMCSPSALVLQNLKTLAVTYLYDSVSSGKTVHFHIRTKFWGSFFKVHL